MSKLNDLINELSPNGVEYKKISDFSKVLRGKRLTTKELNSEAKYPVYHGGLEPLGYYDKSNRLGDTVMIINVGASAGTVGYSNDDFWSSDGCYCLEHNNLFTNKFLYHYLKNNEQYFISMVRKAGIPTLDGKEIEKLKVPVLPLIVQKEITKILDIFSDMGEIIQKEIDESNKMLDFYKQKLLDLNCDVCCIKDVAECHKIKNKDQKFNNAYSITQRGLIPTSEYFGEKTKITSSNTSNYYIVEKDWFVYSPSRIDVGSIGYHKSNEIAIVSPIDVVFSVDSSKIDNDYLLYYLLSANGMSQILFQRQGIDGTGRKNLPFDNFSKIEIPLPSIEVQKEIVGKIKIFENYINDILIPKKELYQKQYEYYRNKLLSFEEVNASE